MSRLNAPKRRHFVGMGDGVKVLGLELRKPFLALGYFQSIRSMLAVQMKGLGFAFQAARNSLMAS